MQVCLIRPPIVVPERNITTMFTPPIGLAYVAGALRDAGHGVTAIDAVGASPETRQRVDNDCFLYGLSLAEIVSRIPKDTDVVGVSAGFSFEWPTCRDLIAAIREQFPDVLLMAGGEHITAMAEYSLSNSALDVCVLGEGEATSVAVVDSYRSEAYDLAQVPGVAFKTADGIKTNPRRERIRAIDDIAHPAWDLFPIEEYLSRGFGFGVDRGRSMPILASRGCPYQCTFCSNAQMWTNRWTPRDAECVLREIDAYLLAYGIQNFDFYDLTAIVKRSWILDFCSRIQAGGYQFTWQLPSGTRSEAIDEEVASALYNAGCRNLSYSPESGSPSVLKRIKKKIKTHSVIQSIRGSVRAGLNVKCNIMMGFPGETLPEVVQTYRFIVGIALAGAHDLSIWAFSPYPGSELFEALRSQGRITVDDAYFDSLRSYADSSRTVSYSEHISDRQLKVLRTLGVALFYGASWMRYPHRPVVTIRNVARGTHESRSEMGIANVLRRRRFALLRRVVG